VQALLVKYSLGLPKFQRLKFSGGVVLYPNLLNGSILLDAIDSAGRGIPAVGCRILRIQPGDLSAKNNKKRLSFIFASSG
jgi:hypothetical protein